MMIKLELTGNERLQFQYILPAQGNLRTLKNVKDILDIVKIKDVEDIKTEATNIFEFKDECIQLMQNSIHQLDNANQLRLESLPLIEKILNNKEN